MDTNCFFQTGHMTDFGKQLFLELNVIKTTRYLSAERGGGNKIKLSIIRDRRESEM